MHDGVELLINNLCFYNRQCVLPVRSNFEIKFFSLGQDGCINLLENANHGKRLLPGRKAAMLLGISQDTLRQYADRGDIIMVRLPSGHRRYDVSAFVSVPDCTSTKRPAGTENVCYCRVSTPGQQTELKNQIEFMRSHYPDHEVIWDVGSAINWNRKNFLSILRRAREGNLRQVVVAYPDRLCRAAFPLVRWLFQEYGVELVVHHSEVDSPEIELTNELLATLTVFVSRLHGRRSYQNRADRGGNGRGRKGKEEGRCSEESGGKGEKSGGEEAESGGESVEVCFKTAAEEDGSSA